MRAPFRLHCFMPAVLLLGSFGQALGDLKAPANTAPEPAPITATEPIGPFSPERAARHVDAVATHWQRTKQCAACHTIPPYLMARPLLRSFVPEPPDVRRFVEDIVAHGREAEPSLPKDGIVAVRVNVAVALAMHDRSTTGKLHPLTRKALDQMWAAQRADGSWQWPYRDVPPIKLDEHYGVTLALLGTGLAPEGYAGGETARKGFERARRFLRANPPSDLHQKAMLAWASVHVEDVIDPAERQRTVAELLAAQRDDGGWSMASLVDDSKDPRRQSEPLQRLVADKGYGTDFLVYAGRSKPYKSQLVSDGYATGFAIYVARQCGVPANDPRLGRGTAWLQSHQRASGGWFTPSQGAHTKNYIARAGTAYAIMALAACDALEDKTK